MAKTEALAKHSCSTRVYSSARWDFNGHLCSRNGVVERDGEWYCRQHDPEAEKAREEKRRAEYRAEMDRENKVLRETRDLIERLGAGTPNYTTINHKLSGGVVLTRQEVERLIAALQERQS